MGGVQSRVVVVVLVVVVLVVRRRRRRRRRRIRSTRRRRRSYWDYSLSPVLTTPVVVDGQGVIPLLIGSMCICGGHMGHRSIPTILGPVVVAMSAMALGVPLTSTFNQML